MMVFSLSIRRFKLCSLAVLMALLAAPLAMFAQERAPAADGLSRVALVIGNGNYEGTTKLNNPGNDATDIGDMLSRLGFDVDVLTDADLYTMEDAVLRFRDKLSDSPDSVGFFYYAGHGVQSNGENYLIRSTRGSIPNPCCGRARFRFSLCWTVWAGPHRLNIIVLDACRDNPFSWARSGARGLAVVGQLPPASIVVYSTSAGKVAQDGTGRNGAFTEELLKHLPTPGLDITEVLRRTGEGVQKKTDGIQIPAIYSQFFGFLQLAPGEGAAGTGAGSGPENGSSWTTFPPFSMRLRWMPSSLSRTPKSSPGTVCGSPRGTSSRRLTPMTAILHSCREDPHGARREYVHRSVSGVLARGPASRRRRRRRARSRHAR